MTFQCASAVKFGSEEAAIAIKPGLLGSHLGIAYHAAGNDHLLHLAFHKFLVDESYPPDPGDWAAKVIDLPTVAASQLVALLIAVAPNETGVPYGINLIDGMGTINDKGEYSAKPGSDGFTCSSFIAELFRKLAFPLVRLETWIPTAQNILWGEAVVCLLKAYGASVEHVTQVEQNNQGLRLRPEEVAAAAEMPPAQRPATQQDVQVRASGVMEEVVACCSPPPHPSGKMKTCIEAYAAGLAAHSAVAGATAESPTGQSNA